MPMTDAQRERYARQLVMQDIGEAGQEKLARASVLVIGAGGLGSPAALYLAAAGVGRLGIVDSDVVDLSNLQRQLLHQTADLGRPKVVSAEASLKALNPEVRVEAMQMMVTRENILPLVTDYDFIIEATDNFPAKFLVNDACVLAGKPFSHGGVLAFHGQTMTYVPGQGPCFRCIFGDIPPKHLVESAKTTGVVGAMAGVIGSLQALEAVKYITGKGSLLTGRLLTADALTMKVRTVDLPDHVSTCPMCGDHAAGRLMDSYEQAE